MTQSLEDTVRHRPSVTFNVFPSILKSIWTILATNELPKRGSVRQKMHFVRPKNAQNHPFNWAQWSRMWGVGLFGQNFWNAIFWFPWPPQVWKGLEKLILRHLSVRKLRKFFINWGHMSILQCKFECGTNFWTQRNASPQCHFRCFPK